MRQENHKTPPPWVDRLLEWLIRERFHDEVIGDLHEWYFLKANDHQGRNLMLRYLLLAFREIKLYQLKTLHRIFYHLIDNTMINNNIKIAVRTLLGSRSFTLINLVGLTTAIACVVLIFAFVQHEMSYDKFHSKKDHIYKLHMRNLETGGTSRGTATPLAPVFMTEFPGSISFARQGRDPVFASVGDKRFYEENFYWTDSSFFDFFDFEFLYGNPELALDQPNRLVLTQSAAEKYFGPGVDPVGKLMDIKVYDGNVDFVMQVDGVLKDLPSNTDFTFEVLGSMHNALDLYSRFSSVWGFNWLHTFAMVPNPSDLDRISEQIPRIMDTYIHTGMGETTTVYFQPLEQVHLYSSDIAGANVTGDIDLVITFSIIGAFILLVALINYINLMTARVHRRSREVGIRKIIGASKGTLINQFMVESLFIVGISTVLAMIAVIFIWPVFSEFVAQDIPLTMLLQQQSILFLGMILLITGLVAGAYPAIVLSSVNGLQVLKGQIMGYKSSRIRSFLVIVQFAISIFLLICSVFIYQQFSFMINKDLGFEQDQLVRLKVEDQSLQDQITVIRDEMQKIPGIVSIAVSGESLPSEMNNGWGIEWDPESAAEDLGIYVVAVDQNYFRTIGVDVISGENFSKPYATDSSRSAIINRAAWNWMEETDPVGMKVKLGGRNRTIIGVVEDFHYQPLHNEVEPVAYLVTRPGYRISPDNIIARVHGNAGFEVLGMMEKVWTGFSTDELFQAEFVNDNYARAYNAEQKFLQLFGVFTSLSVLIGCIGLFGMVIFIVQGKTKEISIRKVLGSGISGILVLLMKQFSVMIVIAFVVAVPVSIYLLQDWLAQFPYRVEINPLYVGLSGVFALMIALITVGVNTLKAARANPVNYLRNE